jgi:uncharacterized membrane protein YqaE (UPF0057 family)
LLNTWISFFFLPCVVTTGRCMIDKHFVILIWLFTLGGWIQLCFNLYILRRQFYLTYGVILCSLF